MTVPALQETHPPTSTGLDSRKLVVWSFIGSECIFFAALISTFLSMHNRKVEGVPLKDVLDVNLTALSTFVLLMSSLTMVLALAAIARGDKGKLRLFLASTAVLGMIFLGGQVYEFTHLFSEGFTISSNVVASSFFTLTGFHGAHVTVGVIWLWFMFIRTVRGEVTKENHLAVELAGLYWHFVDLVWILIFTLVYLID